MKYRSRKTGVCLKGTARPITKQGFTLTATTGAEKVKLRHKN